MTAVQHVGAVLPALAFAALGCSGSPTGPDYTLEIPTAWVAGVTNPYFALVPGTTFEYRAQTDEGLETISVEVLGETRTVNGVEARVVRDRVYLGGQLVEDTYDWYAQDAAGNVWYLGEDTRELRNGQVVSTQGSWEWGAGGARPGILMWADPAAHIGEAYWQELAPGNAEDWGTVIGVDRSVTVPFGSFTNCVETEDRNDLEKGEVEHKFYCAGTGVVLELEDGTERTELVSVTTPP